jgi:hypothetical protein
VGTGRKRFKLEKPRALLSDNDDPAAFVLEDQVDETCKRHFYQLDEAPVTPPTPKQVGILGYPDATKLPVGSIFMATPYWTFGELYDDGNPNNKSCISVSYPKAHTVDAHGLSGSGFWISKDRGGIVWRPTVALIGLATHYVRATEMVVGYRVEKLIEFLNSKQEWMRGGVA